MGAGETPVLSGLERGPAEGRNPSAPARGRSGARPLSGRGLEGAAPFHAGL